MQRQDDRGLPGPASVSIAAMRGSIGAVERQHHARPARLEGRAHIDRGRRREAREVRRHAVPGTSRKSTTTRQGSSSAKTRNGTGWLRPRRSVTPPPPVSARVSSGTTRASAPKACASDGQPASTIRKTHRDGGVQEMDCSAHGRIPGSVSLAEV
jgi:hypothetical protein